MSPRRTDSERLQDLLDGVLPPAEEAALRRDLESREDLRRELRDLSAVMAVLGTPLDVEPPRELVPGILAAVRAERPRTATAILPTGRLQRALVLAGATVLAVAVALGRIAGPPAAEWVGRFVVEGARGFGLVKTAAVDLAHWDWTLRLLATLGRASGTVLGSSAEPLLVLSLVALAITTVFGAVLLRGSRLFRTGGLGHAHVLA